MELELSRNNSSSENSQPLQPNPVFAELQLRRENRRTSENKLAELRTSAPTSIQKRICDLCNQLIIVSFYDQHLADCSRNNANQHDNSDQLIVEDLEEPQRPHEQDVQPLPLDIERNELQVARPVQDNSTNTTQVAPGGLLNLLSNLRNPIRNLTRPQPAEPRLFSPYSLLSGMFSSLFNSSRPNEGPNNRPPQPAIMDEPHSQPESQINQEQQIQPNQAENNANIFPRGAILVRTVQPGPNGSVIVRMRIIPLNEIFSQPQENREGNEPPQEGMFGALLNMLLSLHGARDGFMNLFPEERGLEKETLDSLPVVKYDSEKFKNVDDESKQCSICIENFQDDQEVRFLWCLHRFHKNCVDQWLDKHTSCPICKKDYSEAVKSCEDIKSQE